MIRNAVASVLAVLLVAAVPAAGQLEVEELDGKAGVQVIAGTQVTSGYGYVVALAQFTSDNLFCAGVLVDTDIVVTAAQCVANKASTFVTVLTERYDSSDTFVPEVQEYAVAFMVVHPGYRDDKYKLGNDVAVLKLDRPTMSLDGLPLPTVSLAEGTPAPGSSLEVLGWGASKENGATSDVKKKADVQFITPESCAASYPEQLTDSMLCSQSLESGQYACTGDAGAPLVAEGSGDAAELVGIFSWSSACDFGNPSVYASVPTLKEWIQGVITEIS